jgi:hypothetical protein
MIAERPAPRHGRSPGPSGPGFAVLLTTVLLVSCAQHLPDQDLRILDVRSGIKTSPEFVIQDYQTDKAAADRTYHGKAIDLSGKVTSIEPAATGSKILFTPESKTTPVTVEARLLDDRASETLKDLAAGQRVMLRCFVEGMETNVILKSCIRP